MSERKGYVEVSTGIPPVSTEPLTPPPPLTEPKRMIIFDHPLSSEDVKKFQHLYAESTGKPICVFGDGEHFCLYETDGKRMYPPPDPSGGTTAVLALILSVSALVLAVAALTLAVLLLP